VTEKTLTEFGKLDILVNNAVISIVSGGVRLYPVSPSIYVSETNEVISLSLNIAIPTTEHTPLCSCNGDGLEQQKRGEVVLFPSEPIYIQIADSSIFISCSSNSTLI
jgi:hypothetical protein